MLNKTSTFSFRTMCFVFKTKYLSVKNQGRYPCGINTLWRRRLRSHFTAFPDFSPRKSEKKKNNKHVQFKFFYITSFIQIVLWTVQPNFANDSFSNSVKHCFRRFQKNWSHLCTEKRSYVCQIPEPFISPDLCVCLSYFFYTNF